jgi:hypothetical protein
MVLFKLAILNNKRQTVMIAMNHTYARLMSVL